MKSIDSLIIQAKELKEKGMSEAEIARELHLSVNTVIWLFTRDIRDEAPPTDVKIGWRSLGVYPQRIAMMASIMTDMVLEEQKKQNFEAETITGVAVNGIPFAFCMSEELGIEFSAYRPNATDTTAGGSFGVTFAHVENKKVVIVDDVIGTGETMKTVIRSLRENGADPRLITVMVNKTDKLEIEGVPVRGIIRARTIA